MAEKKDIVFVVILYSQIFDNINILKGFSDDILPSLEKETYDIIYVDGDHAAEAAFKDGVNSFPLLKTGGIMIFDDYLWNGVNINNIIHWNVGNWNNPCAGINCFLFQYKDNIELLDGFEPPVRQIDTRSLYHDKEYQSSYQHNFNYQMFIKKL